MSAQMNQYIIIGTKLGFDEFNEHMKNRYGVDQFGEWPREAIEPYEDSAFEGVHHHKGLCVLYDGRDGMFVVIGHVMLKSENNMPLDNVDFSDYDPTAKGTTQVSGLVECLITEQFGIDNPNISTHLITFYR